LHGNSMPPSAYQKCAQKHLAVGRSPWVDSTEQTVGQSFLSTQGEIRIP
jgi:hypothetical protein